MAFPWGKVVDGGESQNLKSMRKSRTARPVVSQLPMPRDTRQETPNPIVYGNAQESPPMPQMCERRWSVVTSKKENRNAVKMPSVPPPVRPDPCHAMDAVIR